MEASWTGPLPPLHRQRDSRRHRHSRRAQWSFCGCAWFFPSYSRCFPTDVDALHGDFLTSDEFGQRLFAVTTSGLTIVQLANVPLGIGSLAPASAEAAGGAGVTIRGSGFQSATRATLGGKQASVTCKDMNTLSIVTPTLSPGPQQLILINPDGESLAFHAVFFAQ
jgi:hypothetical protein